MIRLHSSILITERDIIMNSGWIVKDDTKTKFSNSSKINSQRREKLKKLAGDLGIDAKYYSVSEADDGYTGLTKLQKDDLIVFGHFPRGNSEPDQYKVVQYSGTPEEHGWSTAANGRILARIKEWKKVEK